MKRKKLAKKKPEKVVKEEPKKPMLVKIVNGIMPDGKTADLIPGKFKTFIPTKENLKTEQPAPAPLPPTKQRTKEEKIADELIREEENEKERRKKKEEKQKKKKQKQIETQNKQKIDEERKKEADEEARKQKRAEERRKRRDKAKNDALARAPIQDPEFSPRPHGRNDDIPTIGSTTLKSKTKTSKPSTATAKPKQNLRKAKNGQACFLSKQEFQKKELEEKELELIQKRELLEKELRYL